MTSPRTNHWYALLAHPLRGERLWELPSLLDEVWAQPAEGKYPMDPAGTEWQFESPYRLEGKDWPVYLTGPNGFLSWAAKQWLVLYSPSSWQDFVAYPHWHVGSRVISRLLCKRLGSPCVVYLSEWSYGCLELMTPEKAFYEEFGLPQLRSALFGQSGEPGQVLQTPDEPVSLDARSYSEYDHAEDRYCLEYLAPVIDPSWKTWNDGLAVWVARTIRQEGRWEDLPILADALEEANCRDENILEHLRSPGDHDTGCWVLNALLRDK